jgi:hypothetical protein
MLLNLETVAEHSFYGLTSLYLKIILRIPNHPPWGVQPPELQATKRDQLPFPG